MTVTTRTNLATNPSAATTATNYAAVAGTGGTAAVAWNSGTGYLNIPGFPRVTWSVATSAISGGISYTQTGLAAATAYATQMWVRCSKAQTLNLKADFRDVSNTIINTVTGSNVAVPANTWTQLFVVGTSGAAVTNVVLTAQAVTGGSNWANGDWLDGEAVLIEATAAVGSYFDGSFLNGGSVMYAWTGTANASTSTATTYAPAIALTGLADFGPCPRVTVTITDLAPTSNIVNLWRTADGTRRAVRGARNRTVVGSDAVTDYEVPLGRSVAYDLEITSGVSAQAAVAQQTVTVTPLMGCMQDPLVPSSAIPVYGDVGPAGEAGLDYDAFGSLNYGATVTLIPIQGSPDPVALIGQRQSAGKIDFPMTTDSVAQNTAMRTLMKQAAPLLFRPLPAWSSALPGLAYLAVPDEPEMPINEKFGGTRIRWQLKGDLVAGPTVDVVVPVNTYGTVQGLWSMYQQAQTTLSGKTYLRVMLAPATG